MAHFASSNIPMNDDRHTSDTETTLGGQQNIRWEVVARMPGLTPAIIMAGRLKAEGIPTRAWQEGAGQALGLTVGLLGNGYVAVPEEYVEQAMEILGFEPIEDDDYDDDEEWDEWEDDE